MMKVWVLVVGMLAACGINEGDDDGEADARHPKDLVGSWFHDEGRDAGEDHPDFSITLRADGSYVWEYGTETPTGAWATELGGFRLDGSMHAMEISKNCRVMTLDGRVYLGSNDVSDGCGQPLEPLTALERCVVGQFEARGPDLSTFQLSMSEDRTMVEFWNAPGYKSAGNSYTKVGQFQVEPTSGVITMAVPMDTEEVRTTIPQLAGMTRTTPVATGCDMQSFRALAGD